MHEAELLLCFLRPLTNAGFEYMVTGSVASIIYGQPRLTHDVDLVLELQADRVSEFASLFPEEEFYCPPVDSILSEVDRPAEGHFNLIHQDSGFKADIYAKGEDALHQWAFERREIIELDDVNIWVAPPEYVIIRKLEYFREGGSDKHLQDIRSILATSGDVIDNASLQKLIEEMGLEKQWEQLGRHQ